MSNHIVTSYDQELQNLRRSIAEMGGIAEKMVADSGLALLRRDTALAQAVITADQRLDGLQREIEEKAILLIAKRQPMAIDLRETISAIRVSGDLERIGDLAKNVAKRVVAIADQVQLQKIVVGVEHMNELVQGQLKDVLDAYATQDTVAALDVWPGTAASTRSTLRCSAELLTYMMEDPRNITFCTHLLFCAKNVERIGDHTTNIAETIHYLATGETLTTDRPKNDGSSFATVDPQSSPQSPTKA